MAFSNLNSVSQQLAAMAHQQRMIERQQQLSPGEVREEPPHQEEDDFIPNTNIHVICRDCLTFPPNIVENFAAGDLVCGDCGLVLSERIVDTRSEWRTFANNDECGDDPSRIGEAAGVEGEELHTKLAYTDSEAGKALSRAQAQATSTNRERKQKALRAEISDLCGGGRLNETVSRYAEELFVKSRSTLKIRPPINHQAACIFIACRKAGVPRTFKEIAELCGKIELTDLNQAFSKVEQFMRRNTKGNTAVVGGALMKQTQYARAKAAPAEKLVARFSNRLGIDPAVVLKIEDCARALTGSGCLDTNSPWTIAGVAIYVVTHLQGVPKSATQIAKAIECNGNTIRKAYKLAFPHRENWVKDSWVMNGGTLELLPNSNQYVKPEAVESV